MKPTSQRKMFPGKMNFSIELQNIPAQKKKKNDVLREAQGHCFNCKLRLLGVKHNTETLRCFSLISRGNSHVKRLIYEITYIVIIVLVVLQFHRGTVETTTSNYYSARQIKEKTCTRPSNYSTVCTPMYFQYIHFTSLFLHENKTLSTV